VVSNAIELRSIVVLIRRAEASQSGKDVLRRRDASELRVNQRVIYQVHRSLQSLDKASYIYSLSSQTFTRLRERDSREASRFTGRSRVRAKGSREDGIGVKR
jgi:hypothetical protein